MTALPDDVRAQLLLAYARTGAFFRTGAWLIPPPDVPAARQVR